MHARHVAAPERRFIPLWESTLGLTTLLLPGAAFGDAGQSLQLGGVTVAANGQFVVGLTASPATVVAGFNNANTALGGAATASFAMGNAGSHFGKVGTGTTTFTANNAAVAGSISVRDGQVTISGGSGSIANGANPQGPIGVYAGAMRGMNTDATVVIGDGPLLSPPLVSHTWSAIGMHDKYWPPVARKLRDGALVLVNDATFETELDEGRYRVLRVPATDTADALGNPLGGSMVMAGADTA